MCYCRDAIATLGRGISSIAYLYCHQSLLAMQFLYLLTPILMEMDYEDDDDDDYDEDDEVIITRRVIMTY